MDMTYNALLALTTAADLARRAGVDRAEINKLTSVADRLLSDLRNRVMDSIQDDGHPKLTYEEKELAPKDKIGAIKAVRTRLGLGLKEAKELVDNYLSEYYIYDYQSSKYTRR